MAKARTKKTAGIAKYLYILPLLILVVAVYIYPVVRSINFSLYNLPFGTAKGNFIGLKNFTAILKDPVFGTSFKNNIIWAFANLILQLFVAMGIAAVLNQNFRGKNVVRSMVLLPWIIPTAAVACIIRWVLLPNLGIVNELLTRAGLISSPVDFLGSQNAMKTLVVLSSWKFIPIGVLLILAAMQTIPKDVYESANVDGANAFQQFFLITYPIISSMLYFTSFIIFVWNFNAFDMIWMVTQGGPGEATQTLPIMVYRSAFKTMRLGESSAIAVIIAVLLSIVGFLYFKFLAKEGKKDEN